MDIKAAIEQHKKWLEDNSTGERLNLSNADLSGANLRYADLSGANLSNANLRGANLRYADLRGADLSNANLRGANLRYADLRGANLSGANLRGANLSNADLSGADLSYAIGNGIQIKSMQVDEFCVIYTFDQMWIGCQHHTISEWWDFTDDQMEGMESGITDKWQLCKPLFKNIIELSPAAECSS